MEQSILQSPVDTQQRQWRLQWEQGLRYSVYRDVTEQRVGVDGRVLVDLHHLAMRGTRIRSQTGERSCDFLKQQEVSFFQNRDIDSLVWHDGVKKRLCAA